MHDHKDRHPSGSTTPFSHRLKISHIQIKIRHFQIKITQYRIKTSALKLKQVKSKLKQVTSILKFLTSQRYVVEYNLFYTPNAMYWPGTFWSSLSEILYRITLFRNSFLHERISRKFFPEGFIIKISQYMR